VQLLLSRDEETPFSNTIRFYQGLGFDVTVEVHPFSGTPRPVGSGRLFEEIPGRLRRLHTQVSGDVSGYFHKF